MITNPIRPICPICPKHSINFLHHQENISGTAGPDSPDNYQLWPFDCLNDGHFTARLTARVDFSPPPSPPYGQLFVNFFGCPKTLF